MPCIQRQALVPFTPQAMFDLVADVERYPKFLPWCGSSEILRLRDNGVDARLHLRFKGIQQSFSTRNHHQPPGLIRIELLDGPFERLEGAWHFDAIGAPSTRQDGPLGDQLQGTKVSLRLDYQMKSGLLAKLFSPAFDIVAGQMMDAFLARADQVYKKGHETSGTSSFDAAG